MRSLTLPASMFALAGISTITSAVTTAPMVYFLTPHSHSDSDNEIRLPARAVVASATLLNPFLLRPEYAADQRPAPASGDTAVATKPASADDAESIVARLEVVPVTVDRLPELEQPQIPASVSVLPLPPERPSIRTAIRARGAIARPAVRIATRKSAGPVEARLSYAEPVAVSSRYLNAQRYPVQLLPSRTKIAVTAPVARARPAALPSSSVVMPISGGPTAVYDISSATLYLPNGDRLEAHSGLKQNRDNSKSAHLRNLGPTPPGEYILSMREKPFHGVNALRMTPTRNSYTYGRTGFLAHGYLAGSKEDFHSCLSVKDYAILLKAYRSGQVRRITVVERYGLARTFATSLKRWWLASSNH